MCDLVREQATIGLGCVMLQPRLDDPDLARRRWVTVQTGVSHRKPASGLGSRDDGQPCAGGNVTQGLTPSNATLNLSTAAGGRMGVAPAAEQNSASQKPSRFAGWGVAIIANLRRRICDSGHSH